MSQPAEMAKHETKLPNSNQGLEDVSCSERFMELMQVKKQLVHGSINASPKSGERTLYDFLI